MKVTRKHGLLRYTPDDVINAKAELAIKLATQLAICIMEQDGEDSSGRAKFKVMRPVSVAERACQIAEFMFAEFDARQWWIKVEEEGP